MADGICHNVTPCVFMACLNMTKNLYMCEAMQQLTVNNTCVWCVRVLSLSASRPVGI